MLEEEELGRVKHRSRPMSRAVASRRKMLEEEEDVDIESGVEEVNGTDDHMRLNGENDEDTLWALEEPDDDMKGWRMKVIMEDEDGM